MSTRDAQITAQITGDASGAIAAFRATTKEAERSAAAVKAASGQASAGLVITEDRARKAATGVSALGAAVSGLQAEGSAKVNALGASIAGFAGSLGAALGPAGPIVVGTAVATSAIVALFLQTQEKSKETRKAIEEDLKQLAGSSLSVVEDRLVKLNSGDRSARLLRTSTATPSPAELAELGGLQALRAEIARLKPLANRATSSSAAGQNATGVNPELSRLIELSKLEKDLAAQASKVKLIRDDILKTVTDTVDIGIRQKALDEKSRDALQDRKQLTSELAKLQLEAGSLMTAFSDITPTQKADQAIDAWAASALKAGANAEETAATVERLKATFANTQALRESERALADIGKAAELSSKLQALLASNSGDAIAKLEAEYDGLMRTVEDLATESLKLGNAEGKLTAQRAKEALPKLQAERAALLELVRIQKLTAAARQVEANFLKQSSAAYRGETVNITDRNRAANDLLRLETELEGIINGNPEGSKVRVEAERQLKDLRAASVSPAREVAEATQIAADATARLGEGIQSSAQAALSLVQLLGDGNSQLAQMLSSVVSIGSGIGSIGKLASGAGGFTKLFSSAGGIASALGPLAGIAGGAVSLIGSITGKSEAEKRREQEIRQATDDFNAAVADFARSLVDATVKGFSAEREQTASRIGQLVEDAAKASGLDPKSINGVRFTADGITAFQQKLLELARSPGVGREAANAYGNLATLLADVKVQAEAAEAQLREQQAAQIATATEDLRVRALISQGRSQEASVLREQIAAERELTTARDEFAGGAGYVEYLRALADIQAAELAAAAATAARAAALSELDDSLAILGGTAGEQLAATIRTLAELFPELAGLSNGLDLGSAGGLDGFRARLQDQFRALLEGGISETEQPIVDAIKRLLGGIDSALGEIPDAFDAQLEVFRTRAEVFGLTLSEQFAGIGAVFLAKFSDLGDVLGDPAAIAAALGSNAGRAGLRARIGDAIAAILADGKITDGERDYLAALQELFTLVGGVIDSATEEAIAAAGAARAALQADASNRVALFDLGGVEALRTTLQGYGSAFAELFGAFDLNALDGITAAKSELQTLFESLSSLSDDEVLLQFGLTRDELLAALLDTDRGFDALTDTLKAATNATKDFVDEIADEYLRATGRGREADLNGAKSVRDARIEQALANGLGPAILAQIEAIYQSKVAEIESRYAPAPVAIGPAAATATRATSTADRARSRSTTVTTDFGGLSEITGQSLVGVMREVAINTGERGAIVSALVGRLTSGLSSVSSLSFPTYAGGGSGAGVVISGNTFQVTIGALNPGGLTPAVAAEQMSNAMYKALMQKIGKEAVAEIRFLGSSKRT